MLQRVEFGLTNKGFIATGLRGVGKTVLLSAFELLALERGCVAIKHEAVKQPEGFSRKFPSLARRALLEISPADRWRDRGRRAAAILRGFKAKFDPEGRWTVEYDVADMPGVGDTSDFVADLPDLMVALGEAAQEQDQVLVFLIDETQYLATDELSALVMAKHMVNQRSLPIVFAGAGLPQVPTLTTEAQTYAERMFSWPEIGPLAVNEARNALMLPAQAAGCLFAPEALDFISSDTADYRISSRRMARLPGMSRATHPSRFRTPGCEGTRRGGVGSRLLRTSHGWVDRPGSPVCEGAGQSGTGRADARRHRPREGREVVDEDR